MRNFLWIHNLLLISPDLQLVQPTISIEAVSKQPLLDVFLRGELNRCLQRFQINDFMAEDQNSFPEAEIGTIDFGLVMNFGMITLASLRHQAMFSLG